MKRYMFRIFLLAIAMFLIQCPMPCESPPGPTSNNKELGSFMFSADLNNDPQLIDDVTGEILGNTISLYVPPGVDITTLIATFTTNGTNVYVENVAQVSGLSINDFTEIVIYTVVADDFTSNEYTIHVILLT